MNCTVAAPPSRRLYAICRQGVQGAGLQPDQPPSGGTLVPVIDDDHGRDVRDDGSRSSDPQIAIEAAAATASASQSPGVAEKAAQASNGSMRSLLICDDRVDVRVEFSKVLGLGSRDRVNAVPDGLALLDAYQHNAQILIGIHSGTTVGIEAISLLLDKHPLAEPIVFGSLTDIELLAAAYAHGGAGLLLWELGTPWPRISPDSQT